MIYTSVLFDKIKNSFDAALSNAIQTALIGEFGDGGDAKKEHIKKFADNFKEQFSVPISEAIMEGIKYVVTNLAIEGQVVTIGSPTSQTARIVMAPTPKVSGKLMNTLGVNFVDDYKPQYT